MNTRALLDPLFLTTLLGSLAMLWLFVRFLIDDLDLDDEIEPARGLDIEARRPQVHGRRRTQHDGRRPPRDDGKRPRRAA